MYTVREEWEGDVHSVRGGRGLYTQCERSERVMYTVREDGEGDVHSGRGVRG